MERNRDSLLRLIAFALLLNAAFLGMHCSSRSSSKVAEADSPELLARVDALEDGYVDLQGVVLGLVERSPLDNSGLTARVNSLEEIVSSLSETLSQLQAVSTTAIPAIFARLEILTRLSALDNFAQQTTEALSNLNARALGGGPDHTEEIAELRNQVAEIRADVDAGTAAIEANTSAVIINVASIDDLAAAAPVNPGEGGLTAEQAEILTHMSIEQLPVDDAGNTARTIRFSGVNVQVINGRGSTATQDGGGLGNLIIGYQELRTDDGDPLTDDANDRSGSHNLVVGSRNNYSIWGGQVVGRRNTVSGYLSTVSGGRNNTASGQGATVSGGEGNMASGGFSTVSGGRQNTAPGDSSAVGGGWNNTATGNFSTVGGGDGNEAELAYATVSGGRQNTASDNFSTVSGGDGNGAGAAYAAVSGGRGNTASGTFSTVGGGDGNRVELAYATVGGGSQNTASNNGSTVSGGVGNTAELAYATVGGGSQNVASEHGSTVSGGVGNAAELGYATVSGGQGNVASGFAATVSGGRNNRAGSNDQHVP